MMIDISPSLWIVVLWLFVVASAWVFLGFFWALGLFIGGVLAFAALVLFVISITRFI